MEWFFFIVLLLSISSVGSKVDKLIKSDVNNVKKEIHKFDLNEYLNKQVCIHIDNEDVTNSHLLSSMYNVVGTIKEFDNEWLLFEYKDGNKLYNQYLRITDITSINEIRK